MVAVITAQVLFASTQADSIANDIFEIEKKSVLQRISFEKVRIANDYQSADTRFMNLVDSVINYIVQLNIPKPQKNNYLNRLQLFLKNVNRYYSDSYLKNGTYLAILSYYPVMIDWDLKGDLENNLKRYSSFSIKATRFIPSDTIAENFLTDYMKDHQDEIFRYADEFDDRSFIKRLFEKAVKAAPESAKRYYSTANAVSNALYNSNDVYVRKSFEIYYQYGQKSRAYLLLDEIIRNEMSIPVADSIGSNNDVLFSLLVQKTLQPNAVLNYSAHRFLDNAAVDIMRKLNQEVQASNFHFSNFRNRTPEEMFVLLTYGYKETTLSAFQMLLDILKKKAAGIPVNSALISCLDKEDLKQLVVFCDKNQTLPELLLLVDDDRKDYLLSLTTMEDKEDLMPPFKQFSGNTLSDQGYRSISEITKARPPKPVQKDVTTEPTVVQPAPKPNITAEKKPTEVPPVKEIKPEVHEAPGKTTEDVVPAPVPEVIEPISIQLDTLQKIKLALKKNIAKTLQAIPDFINESYAEEILLYAAQREPDELFKKVDAFMRRPYSLKILEQCATNAPVSLKRYLYNTSHPVNYILQHSNNPVVKQIFELNTFIGYQSKPLLLLDDIVHKRLSANEALALGNQPSALFSAIVKIISRKEYVGKYSIDREMRDYTLRFVREINDKIIAGIPQPFYSVETFNAAELYFLMLYGREEVFASTFNGLFNRFMLKLPGNSGQLFLENVSRNGFRDFLSLCSNYGVLEEFLAKFSQTDRQKLLIDYISGLESEKDNLSTVVLIAEALSNLSDVVLLSLLQTEIRKEYERVTLADDKIGISIYGVLSSIVSGNAKAEQKWFNRIARQFSIAPASSLSLQSLIPNGGYCIEQMYFYNDDDGRNSFINFMNTYKNQTAWAVEDYHNYVRIVSTEGQPIEILANKPEYEENGINAIATYLRSKSETPVIIVHRGHSFHTEATLTKIPGSTRLLFVGSCGGFYKISIALENAPEAHIISTKQIGTKTVNDGMLYALNETIRQGKDIVWNDFWEKMREKFAANPYFKDYIPPHKNLESIFIRAYYKVLGV